MLAARLIAVTTLLLGTPLASVGSARAEGRRQVAQMDSSPRAALVAERQRVRAELEKANADVDALKRSGRGLRDDYKLRERLADAEALARRLTELDARLGAGAVAKGSASEAEPHASPADGPAELDAKADILADQAQRLAARGDALLGRARDLRARQTLRRRVGQMERDPFTPLEGSKRRAMTGTLASGGAVTSNGGATNTKTGGPGPAGMVDQGGGTSPTVSTLPPPQTVPAQSAGQPPSSGAVAPSTVGSTPTPARTGDSLSPAPGASTGPSTPTTSTGSAVAAPSSAPTPTSAADAAALSVQLRDLLDPTTLAELQRLEAAGGGGATSFDALERAGAALKARAERLRQQAAALRASEHPAPRGR